MFVAWVLFPVVLLAVCVGCGLIVERLAGWTLPGGLLPVVGLAVVIAAATVTTDFAWSAPLTPIIVAIIALAGYLAGWRRVRALRLDPWTLGASLGVYAACAAPVVLSGSATLLGYFIDNDAAVHLALIDQYLAHGHSLAGVPTSAYELVVHEYLTTSYPPGADVALGAVRPLVGQDVAWIFQPYLAVAMALGAAMLDVLLRGVVASRPLRAAAAFIAGQAGLVYGFYLEASIKELFTLLLITATVVLVFETLSRLRPRAVLPLALVAVAGLDVLNLAIAPWIGFPITVFVLVAAWRLRGAARQIRGRRLALGVAGAAAGLAVLAAPIISHASTFLTAATNVLTGKELANLPAPLLKWEMFGVWPTGDFRFALSTHARLTYALIGVTIAGATLGIVWLARRRAYAPLLMIVGNGVAAAYLLTRASPYASAKVMMIFSLSAVLAAMLGAAALDSAGRRLEGWLLAAVVAAGVLWTNVLAYRHVSVAPRARFAELSAIGARFQGITGTFFNLSDEFAIHFLRPEAPFTAYWTPHVQTPSQPRRTEFQVRRVPWDTDDVAFHYLEGFPLLVLARSPRYSRPPANYRLVLQGHYYTVWERTKSPQVLVHVPLGSWLDPVAVPPCRQVRSLAAQARRDGARLAYVARRPAALLDPTRAARPGSWPAVGQDPGEVIPESAGAATGLLAVRAPGRYQVWLEGSFGQRFDVWVNRHRIGSIGNELAPPGQAYEIGTVTLSAGQVPVMVSRGGSGLGPGADYPQGINRLLGPLMLAPDTGPPAVSQIDPGAARSLCGRSLDWLEIVR